MSRARWGFRATLLALAAGSVGCHILLGSEDFVDRAAGGGDAGGSGGGGITTEDCTNGEDDDLDDAVDCADPDCGAFACVAPPPAGWSTPGAFFIGSPPDDCGPSLLGTKGGLGALSAPSAACGACSCGSSSAVCGTPVVEVFDLSTCTTSLGFETFPVGNACQATVGATVSSLIAGPVAGSGTCSPTGGDASKLPPSFSEEGLLCQAATAGAGCSDADVCAPVPTEGAPSEQCISKAGDVPCPDGDYGVRHVLFGEIEDTRDCTPCGCDVDACGGGIAVYSDATCVTLTETVQADTPCEVTTSALSLKFVSDGQDACVTTGGRSTGSAVGSSPVTVCCLGPAGAPPIQLEPTALVVDANGVIEPSEAAILSPAWSNLDPQNAADVTGTIQNPLGPPGTSYVINEGAAAYSLLAGASSSCTDCYTVTPAGNRPQAHWDFTLDETLSSGQSVAWTLHVGGSFTDVTTAHGAYTPVETLVHFGAIPDAFAPATFDPASPIFRRDAARYVAVIDNGGMPLPVSGSGYDCQLGGSSNYSDVAPDDPSCPAANYLGANGISTGCGTGIFCPRGTVPRQEMAVWITIAELGGAPPSAYTDAVTSRSYDCADNLANQFTDVPDTDPLCAYMHYLWARGGTNTTTIFGPTGSVVREQAARWVVGAFHVPLYGPWP